MRKIPDLKDFTDHELMQALVDVVYEMGWSVAMITPDGEMVPETVNGLVVGTSDFIVNLLGSVQSAGSEDADVVLN